MFDNIGTKLQNLATITTVIGIILSIIAGIAAIVNTSFWIGLLIIIIGGLASWISSWMLYAFGTLVENSQIIADRLSDISAAHSEKPAEPAYSAPRPEAPKVRTLVTEQGAVAWMCSACHTRNDITSMTCKECGRSR